MTTVSSRGGGFVAEVCYQQIGHFRIGYSLLAYAMRAAVTMIGLGLGAVLLSRSEKSL